MELAGLLTAGFRAQTMEGSCFSTLWLCNGPTYEGCCMAAPATGSVETGNIKAPHAASDEAFWIKACLRNIDFSFVSAPHVHTSSTRIFDWPVFFPPFCLLNI